MSVAAVECFGLTRVIHIRFSWIIECYTIACAIEEHLTLNQIL